MDTNFEEMKDWKNKLGKYIGHVTQKFSRGIAARKKAKMDIWIRYNHAAFIIQWGYRNWRNKCQMRALPLRAAYIANMTEKTPPPKLRESLTSPSTVEDLTQKIVRNKATYEEIMIVWRHVIELRRGFSHSSTDVLLKALIDSRCDINRAAVLMGNAEFVIRNDPDLPKHIRAQFLPLGNHIVTKEASTAAYEKKKGRRTACTEDDEAELNRGWSNTVDAIRALRQINSNANIEEKVDKKDALLLQVINKCYFSVHHYGSAAGSKFYDHQIAKKSSAESKQ